MAAIVSLFGAKIASLEKMLSITITTNTKILKTLYANFLKETPKRMFSMPAQGISTLR